MQKLRDINLNYLKQYILWILVILKIYLYLDFNVGEIKIEL